MRSRSCCLPRRVRCPEPPRLKSGGPRSTPTGAPELSRPASACSCSIRSGPTLTSNTPVFKTRAPSPQPFGSEGITTTADSWLHQWLHQIVESGASHDPDLRHVVEAWPDLPDAVKSALVRVSWPSSELFCHFFSFVGRDCSANGKHIRRRL